MCFESEVSSCFISGVSSRRGFSSEIGALEMIGSSIIGSTGLESPFVILKYRFLGEVFN